MHDNYLYLAKHLLMELNKLGIVKDAQVNNTTVRVVAGWTEEFLASNQLEISAKEK